MNEMRITAEEMAEMDVVPENKTIQWRGRTITVRPFLLLKETSEFVNGVMAVCFDEERGIIYPEFLDFAFRLNLIRRFSDVELPHDADVQYRLLYMTDLYDIVSEEVNAHQIEALKRAVDVCVGGLSTR